MSVTSVLPGWAEVSAAARDTSLLLKLRWRLIRSTKSRLGVILGLGGFFLLLGIAANIGTLIREWAAQGMQTAASIYAANYVVALDRGDLGIVGATALGSAMAAAMFAPFTGASMIALAPADDLTALRPTRLHRYFDSLVTSSISTIGFLQLISLTAVGSLLTLNGGRTAGLLFTWEVWPVLVLATVAEGWAIELVHRSFGPVARRSLGLGLAGAVVAAALVDPNHGRTLFGVGDLFSQTLTHAANHQNGLVWAAAGVVLVLGVAIFGLGLVLCRAALAKPAGVSLKARARRRLLPISTRPTVALVQLLLAQIWRTIEVRRPLMTVLVIGIPAALLTGDSTTCAMTMVVAIPLSVALAFGINTFGILGAAMPWLASQPGVMRCLLRITVGVQIGITVLLSVLVWTPATIVDHVSLGSVAAIAAGTAVSTLFTTRSAAAKAVNKPYLIRLGSRGDMIVPPLTAINYTLRFALWSGQLGVLTLNAGDAHFTLAGHLFYPGVWLQILLVTVALAWTSVRFVGVFRQWTDRDVQAFIVKQVAAA